MGDVLTMEAHEGASGETIAAEESPAAEAAPLPEEHEDPLGPPPFRSPKAQERASGFKNTPAHNEGEEDAEKETDPSRDSSGRHSPPKALVLQTETEHPSMPKPDPEADTGETLTGKGGKAREGEGRRGGGGGEKRGGGEGEKAQGGGREDEGGASGGEEENGRWTDAMGAGEEIERRDRAEAAKLGFKILEDYGIHRQEMGWFVMEDTHQSGTPHDGTLLQDFSRGSHRRVKSSLRRRRKKFERRKGKNTIGLHSLRPGFCRRLDTIISCRLTSRSNRLNQTIGLSSRTNKRRVRVDAIPNPRCGQEISVWPRGKGQRAFAQRREGGGRRNQAGHGRRSHRQSRNRAVGFIRRLRQRDEKREPIDGFGGSERRWRWGRRGGRVQTGPAQGRQRTGHGRRPPEGAKSGSKFEIEVREKREHLSLDYLPDRG